MSLKKCSICDKEFEGETDICPACANEQAKVSEEVVEVESEIVFEQESALQQEEASKQTTVEEKPQDVNESGKKPVNKKRNLIIGIVIAAVVLIGAGIGAKLYMDKKAHEAYVQEYNDYLEKIKTARNDMLIGAADAESLSNEVKAVWYNAIWKKSDSKTDAYTKSNGVFVSDFNDALHSYLKASSTIDKKLAIRVNQALTSGEMEKLKQVPEGLEDYYSRISDVYEAYVDYTNLAQDPYGSYTTYRDNITSYSSDFLIKYNRMDAYSYEEIE